MRSYEKPDFWALKAQKEDYPARSVYKLKEIDEKFNFFASALTNNAKANTPVLRVLDLGAAPGSWSLYVLRRYGKAAPGGLFLAAADLLPLSRHFEQAGSEQFFFTQGDFTGGPVRDALISRGPYNAIICDAAPPTTGSRTVDTLRSLALVEEALFFVESCLAPGGNLAVKVFQGGDTASLLKQLRECFTGAKSFKPAACRSNSFETYYIGLGKKE
jgi:23S rRNA (uridine2552-2'-O)-methyltransferase